MRAGGELASQPWLHADADLRARHHSILQDVHRAHSIPHRPKSPQSMACSGTGLDPRLHVVGNGREDGHRGPHRPGGQRSTPRSAERAARHPQIPCTPPPGGVDDEQMKRPGSGVEYGSSRTAGRVKNWVSD